MSELALTSVGTKTFLCEIFAEWALGFGGSCAERSEWVRIS